MHPHHENVLVVGAVENHDLALCRSMIVRSPKKVMGEFLMCGLFEASYINPLWICAADDMVDDTVFSCGVETLQYNEKRSLAFRVKSVLELCEVSSVTHKF